MKIIRATRMALVSALLCGGAMNARAQAVEIDYSGIRWSSLSPKDSATRFAILHVDSVSGATQMAYSLAPNSTSPCHWHSASQGSVVAQGAETVTHAGTNGLTLGVGSYSFVPAYTPFRVSTGSSRTIVLVTLDGPFDVNVAPDERCKSSAPAAAAQRAYELDLSRVDWTPFPTKESDVHIAVLRVDSASGATHMFFRIPPNANSPCHWHSPSEANFIVTGSATMRHAGMADAAPLNVGGFSFVPARMRHSIASGPAEMLVFSVLDARFDFHSVPAAECQ